VKDLRKLDCYRVDHPVRGWGGKGEGAFLIPHDGLLLRVLATSDMEWDHVSVSLKEDRCPTWEEMEFIKRLFFRDDETAMQLHVPEVEHINCNPYVLHLWRPQNEVIPRPPAIMV
jgi:hypothetical protein